MSAEPSRPDSAPAPPAKDGDTADAAPEPPTKDGDTPPAGAGGAAPAGAGAGGAAPAGAAAEPVPLGALDLAGLTPALRGKLLLMLAVGKILRRGESDARRSVLVEAFNAAKPRQEAATAAACGGFVEHFEGVDIKCDLSGRHCDARAYDRESWEGNFASILAELRTAIGPTPEGYFDISDLSPAERGLLLVMLWDRRSAMAMAPMQPQFSLSLGVAIEAARSYVDYWGGRPIKCDLSGWHCSPRLYDRNSAPGNFGRVLGELRAAQGRPGPR